MSAASGVVSASSLLSAAAARRGGAIVYGDESLCSYDLGLLCVDAVAPLPPPHNPSSAALEAALLSDATTATQLLVRRIFQLPVSMEEEGPVAELPERSTKLPREKPTPRPKPLTRWQKFALGKGIEKKKRGRMVWDEASGEWKPRFGYKRAGDDSADWAVEVKEGADPNVDPWTQRALEKKQRVLKNKLSHVRNLQHHSKSADAVGGAADTDFAMATPAAVKTLRVTSTKPAGKSGGALVAPKVVETMDRPSRMAPKGKRRSNAAVGGGEGIVRTSASGDMLRVPAGLPSSIRNAEGALKGLPGTTKVKRTRPDETKTVKHERLRMAQVSTASMGRFDKAVAGEPARPKDPRRLHRLPNETSSKSESARQAAILRNVLGGSGEGEGTSHAGTRARRTSVPSAGAGAGGGRGGGKRGGGMSGVKRKRSER